MPNSKFKTLHENFPSFSIFRLVALSIILITTIFLRQDVLGIDVVIKIYAISCLSFFISSVTILFWKQTQETRFFIPYQMTYDILLTSYLIYHTGISESIFLFLYVLNIIHAAIIYGIMGSICMAAMAGSIYGMIYYINKDTTIDNQLYTLFYNELFFLLTGLLSGQLMGELRRKSAQLVSKSEEVERLHNLTDRLINSIPAGIMLVDQNNFVVSVNRSMLELFDLPQSGIEHKTYFSLIPELEGVRARWFSLTEQEKLKFSFKATRGNEEKIYSLQVVFFPDSTEEGAPSSEANAIPVHSRTDLIFVIQDISKVRELEDKLQLDSKLAAIGQLAAGIAHEIRTPLASISGSIETLLKNIKPNNPDDEKLVAISLKEIRRLDRLITEFLIFVKPSSPQVFGEVNLRKTIDEVIVSISNIRNLETTVQIRSDVPKDALVHGDNEKIRQVFFNLFTNAIEASRGKNVEVKVSAREIENAWIVTVEDNGMGIPEAVQEKIFNPFFTTKKNGTGLGLANVAQIVKRHGGDIRSVSVPIGAKFELSFSKRAVDDAKGVAS